MESSLPSFNKGANAKVASTLARGDEVLKADKACSLSSIFTILVF